MVLSIVQTPRILPVPLPSCLPASFAQNKHEQKFPPLLWNLSLRLLKEHRKGKHCSRLLTNGLQIWLGQWSISSFWIVGEVYCALLSALAR